MKGQKKITDRQVFEVLYALSEELEKVDIPYAVIGGFSAQLYLACWYGKQGTVPINKCAMLNDIVRGTGDVDLVVQTKEHSMTEFFNHFARSYPRFTVFNARSYASVQGLSINYIDEPSQLKGPPFVYTFVLKNAETLSVIYGRRILNIKVAPVESLVAAKLSGDRIRQQDWWDLEVILAGLKHINKSMDYNFISRILKETGREERGAILRQLEDELS